jgi:hypothetical protein
MKIMEPLQKAARQDMKSTRTLANSSKNEHGNMKVLANCSQSEDQEHEPLANSGANEDEKHENLANGWLADGDEDHKKDFRGLRHIRRPPFQATAPESIVELNATLMASF